MKNPFKNKLRMLCPRCETPENPFSISCGACGLNLNYYRPKSIVFDPKQWGIIARSLIYFKTKNQTLTPEDLEEINILLKHIPQKAEQEEYVLELRTWKEQQQATRPGANHEKSN
jgi:hypothetical protein